MEYSIFIRALSPIFEMQYYTLALHNKKLKRLDIMLRTKKDVVIGG